MEQEREGRHGKAVDGHRRGVSAKCTYLARHRGEIFGIGAEVFYELRPAARARPPTRDGCFCVPDCLEERPRNGGALDALRRPATAPRNVSTVPLLLHGRHLRDVYSLRLFRFNHFCAPRLVVVRHVKGVQDQTAGFLRTVRGWHGRGGGEGGAREEVWRGNDTNDTAMSTTGGNAAGTIAIRRCSHRPCVARGGRAHGSIARPASHSDRAIS